MCLCVCGVACVLYMVLLCACVWKAAGCAVLPEGSEKENISNWLGAHADQVIRENPASRGTPKDRQLRSHTHHTLNYIIYIYIYIY